MKIDIRQVCFDHRRLRQNEDGRGVTKRDQETKKDTESMKTKRMSYHTYILML
jgi:hypothetical protein